jgi:hypothetical protein
MTTRRDFLKNAVTGALLGGLSPAVAEALTLEPRIAAALLRLLVLGGTGFIGPHLVRHAVSRGHHVSIFSRGRHDADLPASVERLIGDRNGQLQVLEGKRLPMFRRSARREPTLPPRSASSERRGNTSLRRRVVTMHWMRGSTGCGPLARPAA